MQSNYLTRLLVGGTTVALLNAALSISVLASPASARQLVAIGSKKASSGGEQKQKQKENGGTLLAMSSSGKPLGRCPLKHTDVQTEISGYIARVTVKQVFQNPFKDKIEANYTFPLSDNGAVDEMLMKVGTRVIKGQVKKREEARQIYEQAKANGYVASLLDQERTNIFTQSVANIEPGKEIEITIKYIETLPYEAGKFSFTFPTVVGPRFIPGESVGKSGNGSANDTNQVPDASLITPNVVAEGQRAGHDISINVHLDAGMPISQISSKLHEIQVHENGSGKASINLASRTAIANKDFVLSWNVAEDKLKSGYVAYRDPQAKDGVGYFTVMLIPPKRVTPDKIAPKEMIFVIDCSGSQSGAPLDKCKETMRYILNHMNANDTFQIIAFNSNQQTFAAKPQPVSDEMKTKARHFIDGLQANGGTWMAPAVEKACAIPADANRLRIVTFMTDGYVGNDYEVMGMVKKLRGKSRWFSFGTGNSVNHTLIDDIAHEGGGEAEYVLLNSSADEAGKKFYDRISSPVLTDVQLHVDGTTTKEVYPKEVADVWAEKPLYFKGKYLKGGPGTIILKGFAAGKPYEQQLKVQFPESDTKNRGIASMWARAKVDRLMSEDWFGAQNGTANKEIKDEITNVALDHHIMTQYTSFVAVDESAVTKGKLNKTVGVEVEMPDGVSREGVFGNDKNGAPGRMQASVNSVESRRAAPQASFGFGAGGGMGMGGAAKSQVAMRQKASYASGMAMPTAPSSIAAPMPVPKPESSAHSSDESADRPITEKARKAEEVKEVAQVAFDGKSAGEKRDRENKKAKDLSNASKISASLLSKLNHENGTGKANSRLLVELTLKTINAEIEKALKALGVEIVSKKDGKTVKAYVKLDKLQALAALDFVLQIDLASDRK